VKMLLPLIASGLLILIGEGGTSSFAVLLTRYHNHEFEQAVINISLGVVVLALAVSIVLSILIPPRSHNISEETEAEE
jgi:hypothetical protein